MEVLGVNKIIWGKDGQRGDGNSLTLTGLNVNM